MLFARRASPCSRRLPARRAVNGSDLKCLCEGIYTHMSESIYVSNWVAKQVQ